MGEWFHLLFCLQHWRSCRRRTHLWWGNRTLGGTTLTVSGFPSSFASNLDVSVKKDLGILSTGMLVLSTKTGIVYFGHPKKHFQTESSCSCLFTDSSLRELLPLVLCFETDCLDQIIIIIVNWCLEPSQPRGSTSRLNYSNEIIRIIVGVFSLVNHKGLYQGWIIIMTPHLRAWGLDDPILSDSSLLLDLTSVEAAFSLMMAY